MTRAHILINTAVMAALVFVALLPLYSAYESLGFWIALAGGVVLGALVGALGAVFRWPILLVAAVTIAVYFAFGALIVLREEALFGMLPTVDVLVSLAVGSVQVWKQILTLQAPFVGFDHLMIAPYTAGLIGSVTAVSLALRVRRYALALIPVAALLVFAVVFSTYNAFYPGIIGAVFALVSLGWIVWRSEVRRRAGASVVAPGESSGRRVGGTALLATVATLTVAAVIGGGAATALSGGDRAVLRDHVVPPLELHDYASPLSSFRKFVRDAETAETASDVTLFTVTGLPAETPVRLATLDLYDGVVYAVSGSGGAGSGVFSRVGREIPTDVDGDTVTVTVEVGDLPGVWVPTVGYLTSVAPDAATAETWTEALHYNTASGTGVVTTGVRAGDTYTFDAIIPPVPGEDALAKAEIASITTPAPQVVPAELSTALETIVVSAATPLEQLRAIEAWLQEGYFSHGLEGESKSGHSSARQSELLGDTQMVGDDEQYAVAMALMASQIGIPVRVVMGFTPETEGAATAVTGNDLHAWVEVPFTDLGWVSFFPTPSEDRVPQERVPEQQQKPRVQVAQPPDVPQEPAELPPAPPLEEAVSNEEPTDLSWIWTAVQIAGISLLVIALLLGPSIALAVARARRRRRRASAASTAGQMHGGWAEVVDSAVDVGADLPSGATRREQAEMLHATYPEAGVALLARRADVAVFGAGDPSASDVESYWADVDTAVKRIGTSAPWHRRLRAALFPASVITSVKEWRPRRRETRS